MKYTCIASDLDGTLLDSQKHISDNTKAIIKKLYNSGIPFIPATGRPFFAIPKDIIALPGVRYAVVSNGVAIYDVETREPVHVSYIPQDFVPNLFKSLDDETVEFECVVKGRAHISTAAYNKTINSSDDPVRAEYIRSTRTTVDDIKAFMLENKDRLEAIDVRIFLSDRETIRSKICSSCPPVYITSSDKNLLEISNIESGKYRGIAKACALLGLDPSGLIAFGDSDNDVEMLTSAALGIAVDNASEACKQAAHQITESNDDDGVYKALERLFYEK